MDAANCLSLRGQQFLSDAVSLRERRVMDAQQLLYLASEAASFTGVGVEVSGSDLGAVGRVWIEMVEVQVEGGGDGGSTDYNKQLLKVCL